MSGNNGWGPGFTPQQFGGPRFGNFGPGPGFDGGFGPPGPGFGQPGFPAWGGGPGPMMHHQRFAADGPFFDGGYGMGPNNGYGVAMPYHPPPPPGTEPMHFTQQGPMPGVGSKKNKKKKKKQQQQWQAGMAAGLLPDPSNIPLPGAPSGVPAPPLPSAPSMQGNAGQAGVDQDLVSVMVDGFKSCKSKAEADEFEEKVRKAYQIAAKVSGKVGQGQPDSSMPFSVDTGGFSSAGEQVRYRVDGSFRNGHVGPAGQKPIRFALNTPGGPNAQKLRPGFQFTKFVPASGTAVSTQPAKVLDSSPKVESGGFNGPAWSSSSAPVASKSSEKSSPEKDDEFRGARGGGFVSRNGKASGFGRNTFSRSSSSSASSSKSDESPETSDDERRRKRRTRDSERRSESRRSNKKRKSRSRSRSRSRSLIKPPQQQHQPRNKWKKEAKNKPKPFFNVDTSVEKLTERAQRFASDGKKSTSVFGRLGGFPDVLPPSQGSVGGDDHVVGYSTALEKQYLRLTSAPDPATIRPPHVLAKSLELVKDKWAKGEKGEKDYRYAWDQLKSMRQDLTVQGIRTLLTVEVYETHARLAASAKDYGEFNQCLSQLQQLYSSDAFLAEELKNKPEFLAYRLLYYIYTQNSTGMNTLLAQLTPDERKNPFLRHACAVRSAWTLGVYSKIFALYRSADTPALGQLRAMMDWFLPKVRNTALRAIVKTYRPTLPVSFITENLSFPSEEECRKYLDSVGVVYLDGGRSIECKNSVKAVSAL